MLLCDLRWFHTDVSGFNSSYNKFFSNKSCRENQNTNFTFNNFFFRISCRLWDNVEKHGGARETGDENKIRSLRFSSWITMATHTHLEYVTIVAFPLQKRFCEHAWMLRCTYIAPFCCTCLRTKSDYFYTQHLSREGVCSLSGTKLVF